MVAMGSSTLLLSVFTPFLLFSCEILCSEEAKSKDRNAILTSIEDVKLNYLQYLFLSLFLLFFKWKTNSKHT